MMRKRTVFLILAVLVLGGYAVHGQVVSSIFRWSLKEYCQRNLHAHLTFDGLHRRDGRWSLENPRLVSQAALDSGGYHLSAERAAIETSLSWDAGPVVAFNVLLEAPQIDVGKEATTFKTLLHKPKSKFRFFSTRSNLAVSDGKATFYPPAGIAGPSEPIFFNIDFCCDKVKEGVATIHFEGLESGQQGMLEATLAEHEGGTRMVQVGLEEVACAPLWKVVKSLCPGCSVCELSAGVVNGKLAVFLPSQGSPYVEGQALVQGLSFRHPAYEAEGHLPELAIEFVPWLQEDGTMATGGNVELSRSSALAFSNNGQVCWAVESLGGSCAFHSLDQVEIDVQALCSHGGEKRSLQLAGQVQGLVSGLCALTVESRLYAGDPRTDTVIRFAANGSGIDWEHLHLDCRHLTKSEFDFIQHITKSAYPAMNAVYFKRGVVDVSMDMALHKSRPSEIKVPLFAVTDLDLLFWPQGCACTIGKADGSLSIDYSAPDPLKAVNADISIQHGAIAMLSDPAIGRSETAGQEAVVGCGLSDLQARLQVRHGVVQKSFVEGMFAGLRGRMEIDGDSLDKVATLTYEGKLKALSAALPEAVGQGIKKAFADDGLKIVAHVQRAEPGHPKMLLINGTASLAAAGHAAHEMAFGFHVHAGAGQGPQAADHHQACLWQLIGSRITQGWFDAAAVPLEKFLSPFIFQRDQIRLSGIGEFHGAFDGQGVLFQYDAKDVVLKNGDFDIEIKSLSQEDVPERVGRLPATYFVDFTTMSGKGEIPIRQATYFEKNSGLLFTEVNAVFHHQEGEGRLSGMEAFCNGIYFAGQIGLDWSSPGEGVFDVDIRASEMLGKMSQMQQLCTHFNKPLFFLNIPLDGNLALRGSGGHAHFAFKEGDYDLHARIDGTLADGILECANADITLREVGLNFAYDHAGNTLDFTDIQGTLLVGEPNYVEEYAVAGERIHFTDYAQDEAEFDVWVGDKKRDIVRLAGKTRTVRRYPDGAPTLSVMLDHSLSHFGDVYPSVFQLTIKDWSQIESLKLELDLQIKTLLHDLQRFSRTGLMFLSRGLLKELNTLKTAEGGFHVDLSYDGERSLFTYELAGMDIAIGKHKFHKFSLTGNKKNSTWSIEQLQLDDISLAADILKEDRAWKVDFLGARIGDALLAGLEGKFLDDEGKLEANINLLEVDLARLQGWPALKSFVEEIKLGGQLRATGLLLAEFGPELPDGMSMELNLAGSLRGGTLQGLDFQDIDNASLHYKTNSGFAIHNIRTALKGSQHGAVQAGVFLQKVDCNFAHRELIVDKLFFRIPSENLAWLADSLQRSFPGAFKESIADVIRSLKYQDGKQGEVQGALTLELSEPHCALRLSLNDGIYEFMRKEHDVRGFVLEYDPFELKVSAIYRHQNEWFSATVRSNAPSLDAGEIVLLDNPHLDPALQEHLRGGAKPLTVYWQIDPQHGFYIKKMDGVLRGIHVDVLREPSLPLDTDSMYLTGRIQVDMRQAHVLLDPAIAEDLNAWKVGNGYGLQGLWTVDKSSASPLAKSITFHGELQGREFEFLGYQFYNLSARMDYERGTTTIQNLSVTDPCGSMHIGEMSVVPVSGELLETRIPFVALSNFRPGLMRALDLSPSTVGRSLNIRQLEIQDITGIVGDRNSFTGKGRLAFVNPPRKNLQHTIFAIPAEILTRIGLDLAVLTPVRGAIYYQIGNGKVLFTRFKDVYSKGKLSKFYLPNNGYRSCVDFDGNLDLQVRMKQYNLVFKLAELFTVTVQGSLNKPTYSLNKQQKRDGSM